MPRLQIWVLALATIIVADIARASIYVPGQLRDGIYTRPHFLASPNQTPHPRFLVETERDRLGQKMAPQQPPAEQRMPAPAKPLGAPPERGT
jgi:hypothetical protein